MQRRTFLSRLAMLAVALVLTALSFGATSNTASAQITACAAGTYRVDLSALPAAYFPFQLRTLWANGVWWTAAGTYAGPGIYTEAPPVPPGTPLRLISVFGANIPGVPGQTTMNTPAGQVCVRVCTDLGGCLYVKVVPGPCPAALLPCP